MRRTGGSDDNEDDVEEPLSSFLQFGDVVSLRLQHTKNRFLMAHSTRSRNDDGVCEVAVSFIQGRAGKEER